MSNALSRTIDCQTCDATVYRRNNYFTGKLLVEQDFTDEQDYFRQKHRLHNRRLHGTGIVCGLNITAHPDERCQDRLVRMHPGSALDCCGNEILVPLPEWIDLHDFDEVLALADEEGEAMHRLRISICYRECPTEEVPLLYDECGCDDTRCAPNRILESYRINVEVDPEPVEPSSPSSPTLEPAPGIPIAGTRLVEVGNSALYVIGGEQARTVYEVDAQSHAILGAATLPQTGLALQLADDESALFVVTKDIATPDEALIHRIAIDAPGGLAGAPDVSAAMPDSGSEERFSIGTLASGELAILLGQSGILQRWPNDLAAITDAADRGSARHSLTIAHHPSERVEIATQNFAIEALDPSGGVPPTSISIGNVPAGAKMHRIEAIAGPGHRRSIAVDWLSAQLHLVQWSPDLTAAQIIYSAPAPAQPQDLQVSAGGRWGWLLTENAGGDRMVHAIDLHQWADTGDMSIAGSIEVPSTSVSVRVVDSEQRLYVAYTGDESVDHDGGIAVFEFRGGDCLDVLNSPLDCPDCDTPDCITLAIVENYQPGRRILDGPEPAEVGDEALAYIDPRAERVSLPSTQAIAQAVRCLSEHTIAGGVGEQGPPGADGEDGDDGLPGADGEDGLGLIPDLTHICALSRGLGSVFSPESFRRDLSIRFSFSGPVVAKDINEMSVRLQYLDHQGVFRTWRDILLSTGKNLIVGDFKEDCNVESDFQPSDADLVTGVSIEIPKDFSTVMGYYRLVVHGDFIRDEQKRSVDSNHVSPWLTSNGAVNPEHVTGDMTLGGTFLSWFRVARNIGSANAAELERVGFTSNESPEIREFLRDTRIASWDDSALTSRFDEREIGLLRQVYTLGRGDR